MKPKWKGWKEGIITEDLMAVGGTVHRKGSIVRYKRFKSIGDDKLVSEYQWHYLDQNNFNLVRHYKLLIDENKN